MNISSTNYLNLYIPQKPEQATYQAIPQQANENVNASAVNTVNAAYAINPNIPVSYTKTGEINVPGVKENAQLFKLANGQKVIILPKEGPTYIRTSYGVGSMNEPDELRGISHFIEHNLFNGSRSLKPGEYDKKLMALGGKTNAYTSFAQTQYHLNLQLLDENSLEEAIKMNAELTQFPVFDEQALEKEREPVKSEIDMCADNVISSAYSTVIKNLFNIQSSSDDLVIGTKANINSLTRQNLVDYYNTWYTPDNAVTVITGDVDVDETIKTVSKYFNKTPDYSKVNQRKFEPLIPTNRASRVDIKKRNGSDASIIAGFPLDGGTSVDEKNKLAILFSYISSDNSKISEQLDKYGVKLNLFTEMLSCDPNASEVIAAEISLPEEHVEEVMKIIYSGLKELSLNPPKQQDLQSVTNNMLHAMENSQSSENISEELVCAARENNYDYYNSFKNSIMTVTPQELSQLAGRFLNTDRISLCIAHASGTTDEQISANFAKANMQPVQNSTVSFGKTINAYESLKNKIANTEHFVLGNNATLSVIPTGNDYDASFEMMLDSDVNFNITRAEADVLTEILNRGNIFKSNAACNNEKNNFNIANGFAVSQNGIFVTSTFPADKTDYALSLMKETLLNPNFTQAEFDRAKQLVKDNLLNKKKSPDELLNKTLYAADMFYADKQTQLARLEMLTLDDIKKTYYSILNNSQCSSSISIPDEYKEYAKNSSAYHLTTNMPAFRPFIPDKDSTIHLYQPNMREKVIAEAEENSQAQLMQTYTYKDTDNMSDKAKIMLLNTILGGGMSSRLFEDCRNNEKLAYHVSSSTSKNFDVGTINLEIETSTDTGMTPESSPNNIPKSIAAFNRNIERMKTENVTDEELQSAKNVCKAKLLNKLETVSDFNSEILDSKNSAQGVYRQLELLNALDAVSAEDIKAAANYVFENPPITSIVASSNTLRSLNLA